MQFNPLQIARIDGRRRLDDAQGAIFETECRGRYILHFDPLVSENGGGGLYFGNGSHQPGEQVNGVDRLVHQCPTPIEFPSAPPGTTVVVLLCSEPFDVGISEGQPAETSRIDRLFHLEG